jgi:hypothetical protein
MHIPEVHKTEKTLHLLPRYPRDFDWRGVRFPLRRPRGSPGVASGQGEHVCEDLGLSRKVVSVDTKQRAIHLVIEPLITVVADN